MTVRQLLENLDSQELAEWYIIEDFDQWKKRIAEKEARSPSTDFILESLFGKAISEGNVVWRDNQ